MAGRSSVHKPRNDTDTMLPIVAEPMAILARMHGTPAEPVIAHARTRRDSGVMASTTVAR